jgi:DNA-binding HxlR family transcriptional regulator
MPPDVRIEHRYPEALAFVRRHGPDALVVLHELIVRAEVSNGHLVATASTRAVADSLEYPSKDTVHRRLRQLVRAGVIERQPSDGITFGVPTYLLHLADSGIDRITGDRSWPLEPT